MVKNNIMPIKEIETVCTSSIVKASLCGGFNPPTTLMNLNNATGLFGSGVTNCRTGTGYLVNLEGR